MSQKLSYGTHIQEEVISRTKLERVKQDKKWGIRDQHPSVWLTILTEEYGEVAREICEANFDPTKLSDNYEEELVQVIAVAMAMLENHLYNKENNNKDGQ